MDDPDQNSMPAMREMQVSLRTVLYVEDNPANMALVEQLIRRRPDLKLLKAINGLAGVLIARECRPDVVVMDIKLGNYILDCTKHRARYYSALTSINVAE